jgi:hypothetical protein
METLLRHHIEETTRRFAEIRDDTKEIRNSVRDGFDTVDGKIEKLDLKVGEFATFKVQILAHAKLVSAVWGAGWGLVTLVLSLLLKKYID